jgi:predicted MFS family arabinose efflux permease
LNRSRYFLPVIVISQFAGTSLWFAGNAIIGDLRTSMNVGIEDTGIVTSAIQLGFITGTLIFGLLSLSDRYSPRKIFLLCSLLGALSNLLIYFAAYNLFSLLVVRFITGFFLTGIYPIGMKIAAGWYKKGLGSAIGYLVGALVLGTAFPHLLKSLGGSFPWQEVVFSVSGISAAGGLLMYFFVPDGPLASSGTKFNPVQALSIFKYKNFRSAAFGYFGHMWELYTFWAFIPLVIIYYMELHNTQLDISFWSFAVIAMGSIGCIGGGIISKKRGSPAVAYIQLMLSGICCLIAPLMFYVSAPMFIIYLLFWGIVVAGDSPQYSAVIALTVPKEYIGTALTLVVSIGFSITILSLWSVSQFRNMIELPYMLMLLAPGPIAGLLSLNSLFKEQKIAELKEAAETNN